ncbi:helix-turn-helix domain-containing protein [Lysinibacillus halotolerans]|nr:Rgg/GadR/MutR family transcriptional regulator [Lysinibacillus halotolerans]
MEIGQVIRYIRKNKNITQQALADAIGMTRPYIARIESGKNSISSDKLTEILEYCNVTYNEFFYIKNDYKKSSKMNEFNKVLKLYYANEIEEISKIKLEVKKRYEESGDMFLRHLYIQCHCIENDFDLNKINREYLDEIADYLLSVDEWCYHELVMLNNFIFLFPPSTAFLMTKNLLNRAEKYKELNTDSKVLSFLFFNLLEFSFRYDGYNYSKLILDATKKYFTETTEFFEQTLLLFYEGMMDVVENSVTEGIEKCNRAFTVFQALGHDKIYEKYKDELNQLLKKVEANNPAN